VVVLAGHLLAWLRSRQSIKLLPMVHTHIHRYTCVPYWYYGHTKNGTMMVLQYTCTWYLVPTTDYGPPHHHPPSPPPHHHHHYTPPPPHARTHVRTYKRLEIQALRCNDGTRVRTMVRTRVRTNTTLSQKRLEIGHTTPTSRIHVLPCLLTLMSPRLWSAPS
jgi:hypothetical protein